MYLFDLTACPDVITRDITAAHEFIVMACDGIWDVLSNQEVLHFVRTRIAQRTEPSVVSVQHEQLEQVIVGTNANTCLVLTKKNVSLVFRSTVF